MEQVQFGECPFDVFVDDAFRLLLEGLVESRLYFFLLLQQRIGHEGVFIGFERVFHFFEELLVVRSVFLHWLEVAAFLRVLEQS